MNAIVAYDVASKNKKAIKSLASKVIIKGNTEEYVPTNDYEPVTKKYVDDVARYGIMSDTGKTRIFETTSADNQREFFEQAPVAQRDRLVLTVANDFDYTVEINGKVYKYTSDSDASIGEIRDGLEALIDADNAVNCVHDDDDLVITGANTGEFIRIIVGNKIAYTNEVIAHNGNIYHVGSVGIYADGSLVKSSDYVADDQKKIVFNTGRVDGTNVVMVAYGGETVISSTAGNSTETYTKAESDTKFDTIISVDAKIETAKAYAVAMAIAL